MKNAVLLFFCFLLSQISFADLVRNNNFETGGETLADWSANGKEIPAGKVGLAGARESKVLWEQDKSGNKYLVLEGNGTENDFALVESAKFDLIPNQKYRISLKYKAEGLMQEDGKREKSAHAIMDLFIIQPGKGRVGGCRIITWNNSKDWCTLQKNTSHQDFFVAPDAPGCFGVVRLQLVNKYPDNKVRICWDDIMLNPTATELINPGFEQGSQAPDGWKPVGAAKTDWVNTPVKSGKKAIAVADAPDGLFSGWMTEIPIRPDRKYVFGGWVKGGDLNPNGFIGGGALSIEFADAAGSPVGKPVVSAAVGAKKDWTKVETKPAQPPKGAVKAKLIAGMNYCNGTAWFDDLFLETSEAATQETVFVTRQIPAPCAEVQYGKNLLQNGDLEQGQGENPDNWTYVGKNSKDWTKEQIQVFHDQGRPNFAVGRGKGVWSKEVKYAGDRSLLNVSIDPPLSPRSQWYGRNPVDGYWLSDPMPCQPGKAYIAGGWIKPGAEIIGAWYGPLLISFYDKNNRELAPAYNIRSSLNSIPPGDWIYWATQPEVAPKDAGTMRLKFAQELKADNGGWGRTYADNLAVWEVPQGTKVKDLSGLNNRAYQEWFRIAHSTIKPPYLPSPEKIPEYESVWGDVQNVVIGNLFEDPNAPAVIRFRIFNLIGEKRQLKLKVLRTDWLGDGSDPIEADSFEVDGFSEKFLELELPATKAYGTFHLEVTVMEGKAKVGDFSGRYGIMPPLNRPRTTENIWAITPLSNLELNGSKYEMEYGELLKIAGFRKSWIRIYFQCSPYEKEKVETTVTKIKREICWYRALGIEPILQLNPPRLPQKYPRQVDKKLYFKVGEIIGKEFNGLVQAVGNWGIEQANSASPYRGGGNLRITDQEYDTMLASIYDGIKSVAPEMPVMIGNIATDFDAKTIQRLYKAPAEGRFQGAFFNAYMGQLMVGQNMVKEFDKHGNKDYTIWSEEQANQRSPFEGEARRYGEADGPKNMVRTWLSMAVKLHPRIKAVTIWGFAPSSAQDIMMMTPDLQPRPQFAAHAVMANALADAELKADLSTNDISLFEWQRGDGSFFAAWANSGKRSLTLEVPEKELTIMDLMGNQQQLPAKNGLVTLEITSMPQYFFGGGKVSVSKRVVINLANGTVKAGKPELAVNIKNNSKNNISGKIIITGTGKATEQELSLGPEAGKDLLIPIESQLPDSERSSFRAEVVLDNGAVFATTGEFDFAQAVKVSTPPAIDGTWQGWEAAKAIEFGNPNQVLKNGDVGEKYEGRNDLFGKIRLLWDDDNLYLGVEAEDDVFVANPERGRSGFMGDSIEFGVQPNNILNENAPKYEFELYLPADGKYAASRRFPLPGKIVDHWNACAKPTGTRGNAVYQVAIPWKDLDVTGPKAGKTISMSVVLNDKDNAETKFSGGRDLIHWFSGVHTAKNPEKYGDVILVNP